MKRAVEFVLKRFRRWIFNITKYKPLREQFKSIKREQIIDKTIVLNLAKRYRAEIESQLFLIKMLALKGAKIKVLLDDGVLYHWDSYQFDLLSNINKMKRLSFNPYRFDMQRLFHPKLLFYSLSNYNARFLLKRAYKTFKDKNIEFILYSDIFNEKKINIKGWKDLKKHAESSTMRFFKNSELDFNNEYIYHYYKLSYKNALLCKNIGEYVLNTIKPDVFINPHGIYSTHGPAFELLKENGIHCLAVGGFLVHGDDLNKYFMSDTCIQLLSRSKYWKEFRDTPVDEKMERIMRKYFKDRIKGEVKDTKKYYGGEKNLFQVDKNDGYKYHIAMFPNVIWDGNLKERHNIFNGIIDWIIETVDHIKNNNDIKLYIKAHPAELILSNNSPRVIELVKKRVDLDKYNNIEIITPEKKIDTYKFLKSGIDVGLCYDGFLAMEMPYLRIPAIMCVKGGFTSIKGGNFIPNNKEEYFNYLNNIESLITEFNENYYEKYLKNTIRYLYWYLFENPFKILNIDNEKLISQGVKQIKKEKIVFDKKIFKYLE